MAPITSRCKRLLLSKINISETVEIMKITKKKKKEKKKKKGLDTFLTVNGIKIKAYYQAKFVFFIKALLLPVLYGVPRGPKAPIRVDPYFKNTGRPVFLRVDPYFYGSTRIFTGPSV